MSAYFNIKMIRLFLILLALSACKANDLGDQSSATGPLDESVLFTIAEKPVSVEEFKYVYAKNNVNNSEAFTREDISSYLDLFVKFKLKIAEARNRGMDTTKAFDNELNTYLDQLKKPYLTENSVTNRLVKEAYDRYSEEVRASHILIEIDENDTLSSYNQALEVRAQVLNGAPFADMARKYSKDPSAKINGGDLGYFSSFQMVYPFESAAYNTPIGEVSLPVRTQFGYHLIYVADKRPSNGKVQVAHIMLRHQADSATVRNKIFEIYDQAVGGIPWEELVNQYSDDINSKRTNGILRSFSVGQMPIDFQETAFSMEEIGSISDPVQTKYGWHILKLIKKEPVDSFEKLEPTISARISKDPRSKLNEKVLLNRLKQENGFEEDLALYSKIRALADSTLTTGSWDPNISSIGTETLFSVGDEPYRLVDFVSYVKEKKKTSAYDPKKYVDVLYENYKKQEIIAYEEAHLEEKYIDYKMLLREYREGILLFELMEKEVWNKAVEDTLGLKNHFESNREKYQWSVRAKASIYSTNNESILAKVKTAAVADDSLFLNKQALYNKYNAKGSLTLQIEEGIFEKGAVEVLDQCDWQIGVYEKAYAGKKHIVWIQDILQPRVKELNEARGAVISDYQTQLEEKWIEELESKYTIAIDSAVLEDVYEELANK